MPAFPSTMPLVRDIDPDVLATQRQANELIAQMPHPDVRTPDGLAMLRQLTANNVATTVLAPTDHTITLPSGDVRLHTFATDEPARAVMIDIHGGGWAAGAPEDDDTLNDRIGRASRVVVIAPEYRLTPDVTIEDQIDECVAVVEWVGMHARAEFGTDTLILGGISAGAHLAAATLLRLRAAASPTFTKIVAARLDSGPYDLGFTPSGWLANDHSLVLTGDWLRGLLEVGLPNHTIQERRTPALSPVLNDLSGLPPALITAGDLDPLRDDAVLLATRWQLAGSPAELDIWPEGGHAFTNMATPLGDLALGRTIDWINATLDRAAATTATGAAL
jgi:acetyl esterase